MRINFDLCKRCFYSSFCVDVQLKLAKYLENETVYFDSENMTDIRYCDLKRCSYRLEHMVLGTETELPTEYIWY